MRVTYTFGAQVADRDSGKEVPVPDSIDNWEATKERLDRYFDADVADLGVEGGEIRAIAKNGRAELEVVYWLPNGATDELIDDLRDYTVAQLNDGVGEGGFEFGAAGKRLVVTANTEGEVRVRTGEDGRPVTRPSAIAIAARDGDLSALVLEIERDPGGIERLHQGYSALQLAILYGRADAVRILLIGGADPNRLDPEGSTPLELCALSNSIDDEQSRLIAQMLLDAGANPNHISTNGESARSYAESRRKSRMAEIL